MFGLSTENAYICIAFRGKSSLTITLHQYDSYTITLRHKHCTTRTNDLHRFHCISVRRTSRRTNHSRYFSFRLTYLIRFNHGQSKS